MWRTEQDCVVARTRHSRASWNQAVILIGFAKYALEETQLLPEEVSVGGWTYKAAQDLCPTSHILVEIGS